MKTLMLVMASLVSFGSLAQASLGQSLGQEIDRRLPFGTVDGVNAQGACTVIAGTMVGEDPNTIESARVQVVINGQFVEAEIFFDGRVSGGIRGNAVKVSAGRQALLVQDSSPGREIVTVRNNGRTSSCEIAKPSLENR